MLKITTDGRKAALDMRLIDENNPNNYYIDFEINRLSYIDRLMNALIMSNKYSFKVLEIIKIVLLLTLIAKKLKVKLNLKLTA